MARLVLNPTDQDLFCVAAGTIVPARGTVEVSDPVAAAVVETVFEIGDLPVEEPAPADPAPAPEAAPAEPAAPADPASIEGA